jgi:ribosomal protein S18 acetylase RimI-like enzyme
VVIRPAEKTDASRISILLPDLGYKAEEADVAARLARLATRPENLVIVAEVAGLVVGLCHVQGVPLLATDGYAEVQALVVSSKCQRQGVGAALLRASVVWASGQGYRRVRLRSGLHREQAHRFYESQGFKRSRASYAFELEEKFSDA